MATRSLLFAAAAALLCVSAPAGVKPGLAAEPGTAAANPAEARVSFKEWAVPTAGSHPHDPLAAADGSIWYTGQMANTLGRLDPRPGAFKEYRLKTPDSGPHGLAADKDGNIWFTANFQGYIGKLDPKTGTVTEYRLPDPAARDPHTPVFDRSGTLWFTVQGGNMVGRLVPQTGAVTLKRVPTADALPYGLAVNPEGVPFFAEFGSNKLASIDPKSMAIREYTLPNAEARPRRLAIGGDGAIWYTDYARGYLGRFDPKTGAASEWPSPGGPESRLTASPSRRAPFVQRIRRKSEYARAIRPGGPEVPDVADSVGRRGGAQHDGDPGRRPRAGVQRGEPHRARGNTLDAPPRLRAGSASAAPAMAWARD